MRQGSTMTTTTTVVLLLIVLLFDQQQVVEARRGRGRGKTKSRVRWGELSFLVAIQLNDSTSPCRYKSDCQSRESIEIQSRINITTTTTWVWLNSSGLVNEIIPSWFLSAFRLGCKNPTRLALWLWIHTRPQNRVPVLGQGKSASRYNLVQGWRGDIQPRVHDGKGN